MPAGGCARQHGVQVHTVVRERNLAPVIVAARPSPAENSVTPGTAGIEIAASVPRSRCAAAVEIVSPPAGAVPRTGWWGRSPLVRPPASITNNAISQSGQSRRHRRQFSPLLHSSAPSPPRGSGQTHLSLGDSEPGRITWRRPRAAKSEICLRLIDKRQAAILDTLSGVLTDGGVGTSARRAARRSHSMPNTARTSSSSTSGCPTATGSRRCRHCASSIPTPPW